MAERKPKWWFLSLAEIFVHVNLVLLGVFLFGFGNNLGFLFVIPGFLALTYVISNTKEYSMGWDTRKIEIVGHVSRHNSDKDALDDSLFDELEHRIEMIVKEHRYESLNISII